MTPIKLYYLKFITSGETSFISEVRASFFKCNSLLVLTEPAFLKFFNLILVDDLVAKWLDHSRGFSMRLETIPHVERQ